MCKGSSNNIEKHVAEEVICAYDDCIGYVESVHAADVAPVVHGEWEIKARIYRMMDDIDEVLYVECPICKREFHVPSTYDDEEITKYAREHYPYCNCGAKMDGERKEE